MKVVLDDNLKKIEGGGFSFAAGIVISGLLVFFAGIMDGFSRPIGCNK